MQLLLDTHVLLRAAYMPERLTAPIREEMSDEHNELAFSSASVWEVSIKAGLGRADFDADPHTLRRELLENGYREIAVTSAHAAAVFDLPTIHRDPFDRLLVAQSRVEGITLLTADQTVAKYGPPVRQIGQAPTRPLG